MRVRSEVAHYWRLGTGVSETIDAMTIRHGVRLRFEDVHDTFVALSADPSEMWFGVPLAPMRQAA